jgi:uncharacterized protein GlcG (DUF336 family)
MKRTCFWMMGAAQSGAGTALAADPVVIMRETLAPLLTRETSRQKAYTAMAVKATTSSIKDRFTKPFRTGNVRGIGSSEGGLPSAAVSGIPGGVGVTGAPAGEQDERCAAAGPKAIQEDLGLAVL